MIIGTHNSFTYLKPRTWIGRLFASFGRCQEVSIYDQYEKYGVRAFDFKIRLDREGKPVIANGMFEYMDSVNELNRAFNFLDSKGDCYVRISLETGNDFTRSEAQDAWFRSYCSKIESEYHGIKFFGGTESVEPRCIYIFNTKYPSSDGFYASWATKNMLDDLFAKWYARKHNKESYEKGTTKDIMFLDFVNIGRN